MPNADIRNGGAKILTKPFWFRFSGFELNSKWVFFRDNLAVLLIELSSSSSSSKSRFEMSDSVLTEKFSLDPKLRNLRKRKRLDELLHKISNAKYGSIFWKDSFKSSFMASAIFFFFNGYNRKLVWKSFSFLTRLTLSFRRVLKEQIL